VPGDAVLQRVAWNERRDFRDEMWCDSVSLANRSNETLSSYRRRRLVKKAQGGRIGAVHAERRIPKVNSRELGSKLKKKGPDPSPEIRLHVLKSAVVRVGNGRHSAATNP